MKVEVDHEKICLETPANPSFRIFTINQEFQAKSSFFDMSRLDNNDSVSERGGRSIKLTPIKTINGRIVRTGNGVSDVEENPFCVPCLMQGRHMWL